LPNLGSKVALVVGVHCQHPHRGATHCCQSDDINALTLEMLFPELGTRIEEPDNLTGAAGLPGRSRWRLLSKKIAGFCLEDRDDLNRVDVGIVLVALLRREFACRAPVGEVVDTRL